ncbi:MAG: hypothetical protein M0000_04100, partial [Actinomycetota bacterium]|nr:hypothetical protein [Actinomycetota bacterium]
LRTRRQEQCFGEVSLPPAASTLSFCPDSWPVRSEQTPTPNGQQMPATPAKEPTFQELGLLDKARAVAVGGDDVVVAGGAHPSPNGGDCQSQPSAGFTAGEEAVSEVEEVVFGSDGGPVIDVEAVEVPVNASVPLRSLGAVSSALDCGASPGRGRVPGKSRPLVAALSLVAAICLIAMGLGYLGQGLVRTGPAVSSPPVRPSTVAPTLIHNKPLARSEASGGKVLRSRSPVVKRRSTVAESRSFASPPRRSAVHPEGSSQSSPTREVNGKPTGSIQETLTVRAPVEPQPAALRGGIEYPSSVGSLLAPYAGERISVRAVIDAAGRAHVESVGARFPLAGFVQERFREVVERSHWEGARDEWGRPVAANVNIVITVR